MMNKYPKCYILSVLVLCVFCVGMLVPAGVLAATGERDTRFLLPDEVPADAAPASKESAFGSTSRQDARDRSFRTPEEIAEMGTGAVMSNEGARDRSFRTPEEIAAIGSGTGHTGGIRRTGEATIGNCREWVNVRNDPSTNKTPIGRINLGDSVSISRWSDSAQWAYVSYSNGTKTGWIYAKFIKQ